MDKKERIEEADREEIPIFNCFLSVDVPIHPGKPCSLINKRGQTPFGDFC